MSLDHASMDGSSATTSNTPLPSTTSRRQVLKWLAATSLAAVGGATLSACGSTGSTTTNVTLYVANGWPWAPLPSKTDQAKSSLTKAYAETLNNWLKQHPGVSLKNSTANIWDTQALTTSISTGTNPTFYYGNQLGGWDNIVTRAAYARGLAADVTDQYNSHNVRAKTISYARDLFDKMYVNGRLYCAPLGYFTGAGLYYRRDLLPEIGMSDPQYSWTWEDYRAYAKAYTRDGRKGSTMKLQGIADVLQANSFGLLTRIPSPDTPFHWRYDFTSLIDNWTKYINIWRDMLFKDQSLLSNANLADGDLSSNFINEKANMTALNDGFFTHPASDTGGFLAMANKKGKGLDELVGYVPECMGEGGSISINSMPWMGNLAFDPHLKRTPGGVDAAFDLYYYFTYGQGYIDQGVANWNASKDLHQVYSTVTPVNGMTKIPGVPGSATDAWGQRWFNVEKWAADQPVVPNIDWYFPPEQNPGMTTDAQNDAASALEYTQNPVSDIMKHWEDVYNQQAATLSSSIPKDAFVKSARKFYADHDTLWKKVAPQFYSDVFQPWYEKKILPIIGH